MKTLNTQIQTKHDENEKNKTKKEEGNTKNKKRQTALTRHRSENRQHDVLGWKDLCLGGI